MNDCPLCKAEKKTRWYYEDNKIWVADCESCGLPMVVLKAHRQSIPPSEIASIKKLLEEIVFKEPIKFRGYMRRYPNHWHDHILEP